ncbi:MAG: AMP-binding protein, partial [Rhodobacterales bacterium]|nr:AMP-binding protein [Rhodobacterales bacterium]
MLTAGRRDPYMTLDVHALNRPNHPAISDVSGTSSYAVVARQARQIAGALHRVGVRPQDRVAVFVGNRREHIIAMAAIRRLGAIPMPLSPKSAPPQVIQRLNETKAVAAFVPAGLAKPAIQALIRNKHRVIVVGGNAPKRAVSWEKLLTWDAYPPFTKRRVTGTPDIEMHTSGTTTGQSSRTSLSMANARMGTAFQYIDSFDFTPDAVLYTPCPLYHAAPMLLTGLTMAVGGHIVLRDRFDDDAIDTLIHAGVTHAFLVPTLLDRLARRPEAHLLRLRRSPLRALISGGALLRPKLKTTLLDLLGPVLYDFYGATELGVISIAGPEDLATHPSSQGRILPGVKTRVVDANGDLVPYGSPGQLYVRSDTMTLDTRSPLQGWMSAGDVARIEDGYLYIVDRIRDVVISGGVNLFPVDIEVVVEAHESVHECAAVGVPDDEWGEALQVFVVL